MSLKVQIQSPLRDVVSHSVEQWAPKHLLECFPVVNAMASHHAPIALIKS